MVFTQIHAGIIIGSLPLVIGLLTSFFPAKTINQWYGYRVPSASKSQKMWDEAQVYGTKLMITTGYVAFPTVLVIFYFTPYPQLLMFFAALYPIMIVVPTLLLIEKHVKKLG